MFFCVTLPPKCDKPPVFQYPESWDVIGHLPFGATAVAARPPLLTNGCPMIPMEVPCGAVDGRHISVVAPSVGRGPPQGDLFLKAEDQPPHSQDQPPISDSRDFESFV